MKYWYMTASSVSEKKKDIVSVQNEKVGLKKRRSRSRSRSRRRSRPLLMLTWLSKGLTMSGNSVPKERRLTVWAVLNLSLFMRFVFFFLLLRSYEVRRGEGKILSEISEGIDIVHVHVMLLKAFSWGDVNVPSHLVHLNMTMQATAFLVVFQLFWHSISFALKEARIDSEIE
jgi:hypothetical protein